MRDGKSSHLNTTCDIGELDSPGPDRGKRGAMWREPLTGNTGENTGSQNLSTKRQRIAKPARTKRGVAFPLRDFLDRRVRDGVNDNIRERNSSMKNRKRESCTSGSVRDEGGNILIYSAACGRGDVADRGTGPGATAHPRDRLSQRRNRRE